MFFGIRHADSKYDRVYTPADNLWLAIIEADTPEDALRRHKGWRGTAAVKATALPYQRIHRVFGTRTLLATSQLAYAFADLFGTKWAAEQRRILENGGWIETDFSLFARVDTKTPRPRGRR